MSMWTRKGGNCDLGSPDFVRATCSALKCAVFGQICRPT